MNLISIIIALIVEHFVTTLPDLRRFAWVNTYVEGLRGRLQGVNLHDGPLGLFITIALPTLTVWLLDSLLGNVFAGDP